MLHRDLRERNRQSWNATVAAHNSHRGDQAAFLRSGGLTLFSEERELLGDVAGRSLAHLMCNAGQDSLSLALLGATVTGVDSSDEAITYARRLAQESGISATFEQADIYDWLAAAAQAQRSFEIVYSAYGAICWLPDLAVWAQGVATVLNTGGSFVLVEFHPASNMFDHAGKLAYPYPSGGELLELPGVGDYVSDSLGGLAPAGFEQGIQNFVNPYACFLFRWGLGEVVSALLEAGLTLTALREYMYVNGERPFAAMRPGSGRRWLPPEHMPAIPLMYGLSARK